MQLEDLQHVLTSPKSIFSEMMKIAASKSASAVPDITADSGSASLNSLQRGTVDGSFDPPTIPTTTVNGASVTNLGVIGRGVKRAALSPVGTEPSSKKHSVESSSEKDGCSVPEAVESTVQAAETTKE